MCIRDSTNGWTYRKSKLYKTYNTKSLYKSKNYTKSCKTYNLVFGSSTKSFSKQEDDRLVSYKRMFLDSIAIGQTQEAKAEDCIPKIDMNYSASLFDTIKRGGPRPAQAPEPTNVPLPVFPCQRVSFGRLSSIVLLHFILCLQKVGSLYSSYNSDLPLSALVTSIILLSLLFKPVKLLTNLLLLADHISLVYVRLFSLVYDN